LLRSGVPVLAPGQKTGDAVRKLRAATRRVTVSGRTSRWREKPKGTSGAGPASICAGGALDATTSSL